MGDDKWIHREPGSISGSFVPPPVDSDETHESRPPLPRRKPFTRPGSGSGPRRWQQGQSQGAQPQLPDNVRYLFKPVLTQTAPEIEPVSAEGDPRSDRRADLLARTDTEARNTPAGRGRSPASSADKKAARPIHERPAADRERGSGQSALAREPRTSALPVTAPPACEPLVAPPPAIAAPAITRPEAGTHRRRSVGLTDGQPTAAGAGSWVRSRVRRHGIQIAVTFLVVIAVISTAFALVRHGSTAGKAGLAGAGRVPHTSRKAGGPSNGGKAIAGLSAAGIVRAQAARWVSAQISKNAIIACDDVMCSELINEGVSASNLLVLSPTAPDPLGADIVMGTAALRSQFGSRLATEYAPSVIASFGSGRSRVDVRVVAADGAAAYEKAQASAVAARQRDGSLLLHNSKISVSAAAEPELIAGLVDPRLLVMLPVLAGQHPIRIVGFYDRAPRSSPGIPLTGAELAGADPAAGLSGSSYLRWLLTFLRGQRAQFRPVSITTARANGLVVVRIRFARPSPIGLP
jgi:hypothetical protein